MYFAEDKSQFSVTEPGDATVLLGESVKDEEGVVGPSSVSDRDGVGVDADVRSRVNELPEQSPSGVGFVAVSDPVGKQSVQCGGKDGELEIDVDLERYSSREGIHMEQIDGLGDGVFDDHAPGIAVGQPGGCLVGLIGDQQGRLVVAETSDCNLSQGSGISRQ